MAGLITALSGAVAQGIIWGIMAIGVYLTYRVLDVADLTVDGTLATGGATLVMCTIGGMPVWMALIVAVLAGCVAGLVTGIFHTKFGIPAILAGILTQLALYSINLRILGDKANQTISVVQYDLMVSLRNIPAAIIVAGIMAVALIVVLYWFFGTELGCSIRATGCNQAMSRANGINTERNKVVGLVVSNGIVALSGALLAQYQGFADVKMGQGAIVIGLAAVIIGEAIFGKIFKNFALRLLSVALGSVIYYIVVQAVITMGLDANLLKLLSAVIVAIFLAIPYWKNQHKAKHMVKSKGGKANA